MSSLFEKSYARVLGGDGYNKAFITRFYELFIASSPAVASAFKDTDMSVQKTMLHDSLQVIVDYYRSGTVNLQLKCIALVHSRYGQNIKAALYDDWMNSLIGVVKEFDPDYNHSVEQAWREAFAPGIQYMIAAYDA